jgi:hypothetical protein
MADTKVSELLEATQATAADLLYIVDGTTSKKITIANIEGSLDHDNLTNTHNLTTDIDHDALTNFNSNEHFTVASISHTAIADIGTRTHAELETSCALISPHIADATIHFTSNALWTAINLNTAKVSYTDEALVDATVASCALNTAHREDSSDPHGATLTQTYLNVASCAITADNTTVSMAFVRNIVFGTSATPPTASNFTQGTLYVQYTP